MKWNSHKEFNTIIINEISWFKDNLYDINIWLQSEGIKQIDASFFNKYRISLYSKKQMAYFTLRWPK